MENIKEYILLGAIILVTFVVITVGFIMAAKV